jgi:hypothetical protein
LFMRVIFIRVSINCNRRNANWSRTFWFLSPWSCFWSNGNAWNCHSTSFSVTFSQIYRDSIGVWR